MPSTAPPQAPVPRATALHAAPRHDPDLWGEHAADSARLRLTTRGRCLLIACAVIVASLLGFAAATAARASYPGAPSRPAGHAISRIVVQPGQTLWSIAVRADPTADPRLVIQQIVRANALTGENVAAGQRLWVPQG